MKNRFSLRIGILGGGQLARMLVLKGHEMGFAMRVLCPSASEPAAQVTAGVLLGNPNRREDVREFAKTVDLLALESEFHSGEMLEKALEGLPVKIYPRPSLIAQLQDRLPQKQLLTQYKIPTADFLAVSSQEDLATAVEKFGYRFVLKKRMGGYDGYGTTLVRSKKEFDNVRGFNFQDSPCIAEQFIPFRRELAVQFARTHQGKAVAFPLVETHQVDQRLDWLCGPIHHKSFPALAKKLSRFVEKIDSVGVIAFELFDTGRELYVNEIAPRVHNSGHASLEALSVDQFSQHLKAIAGLTLSIPELQTRGFALSNLIGGNASTPAFPSSLKSHLHWYGKAESRKGRKMGHLTATGNNPKKCLAQVLRERKGFSL